MSDSKAA
jgi:acidic leucine-rich nuclear phosphoprotein 32 family member A/C/D